MTEPDVSCFLANDIRGIVPTQINNEIAYKIGWAFVTHLKAEKICIGHDVRLSSPELTESLVRGALDAGCDVYPLELCGTEQVYFTVASLELDGGIMVTASHNPSEYNGMKFVGKKAQPISAQSGLNEIKLLVEGVSNITPAPKKGSLQSKITSEDYIDHLLEYVNIDNPHRIKIVVDSGNGCAGPIVDALESQLPFELVKVRNHPDGSFPHGVPNPLLIENREFTARAIRDYAADFGVAWDGDFDRCFFFDENGNFIESYYLVALFAKLFLKKGKQKIIHDPRLVWNTREAVIQAGGTPIMSRTGHAFIKELMRKEDAVYGGEMSGHHYFKSFYYCDSGMIPWLIISGLLAASHKPLSAFIKDASDKYPVSGEINRKVDDAQAVIAKVQSAFEYEALKVEDIDGLSMAFDKWRFNLRTSNTESLLRLNVEACEDQGLVQEKTKKILDIFGCH